MFDSVDNLSDENYLGTLEWSNFTRTFDIPEFIDKKGKLCSPIFQMQQLDAFLAFLTPSIKHVKRRRTADPDSEQEPKKHVLFDHPLFDENILKFVFECLGVRATPPHHRPSFSDVVSDFHRGW